MDKLVIPRGSATIESAVYKDEKLWRLWCHLALNASGDDAELFGVHIPAGAVLTSAKEIARELGWSASAVDRAVKKLIQIGELSREQPAALDHGVMHKSMHNMMHRKKLFRLANYGQKARTRKRRDVQVDAEVDVQPDAHVDAKPAPKKATRSAAFEKWYQAYPRKQAPGVAERAYVKAVKRVMELKECSGTEAREILLARASKFAEIVSGKIEMSLIPHPATWLNGERYREGTETWMQLAREAEGYGHAVPEEFTPLPRRKKKEKFKVRRAEDEQSNRSA